MSRVALMHMPTWQAAFCGGSACSSLWYERFTLPLMAAASLATDEADLAFF